MLKVAPEQGQHLEVKPSLNLAPWALYPLGCVKEVRPELK